jgi:acetyl-CoA carboxylase biotin carboxylase subunit
MIRRLLIANRGEIAVRIIRACRERGIESVAVASEADREALHARLADHVVPIGPPPAAASYLAIDKLIDAARRTSADAVHPGYGFLAENAHFAAACADAGLIFVGPPAHVIARMGSKLEARDLMARAGVPCVPGARPADQSNEGLAKAVGQVGFPVLIKPSAGGGGKGMRAVSDQSGLLDAIEASRREAMAAFGDGTLYVERLLDRPRHVEIQVLADRQGQCVHLFERECSVQRRHQKIVEESPAPTIVPELRRQMGASAVAAAKAAGYVNAGTVEFLVEGTGAAHYYFLEMNTRLQVEHPTTELVTGVDLVAAQLDIASGQPLAWSQDELSQRGHAIECRIYAEDPAHDFLPQAGPLLLYREPSGPGIRVDSGIAEGDEVTVHYDPLLAKLIASAETRTLAIGRAAAALEAYAILGIRTNLPFLRRLLAHPRFLAGDIDTGWLDAEGDTLKLSPSDDTLAALVAAAVHAAREREQGMAPDRVGQAADPWDTLAGWRP